MCVLFHYTIDLHGTNGNHEIKKVEEEFTAMQAVTDSQPMRRTKFEYISIKIFPRSH